MKIYESVPGQFPGNAALDLVPLPGESMVSSLWRFAWRNGLSTKELLRFCTHGNGYQKEHAAYSYKRGFDPDIFSDASGWPDQSPEVLFFGPVHKPRRTVWWSGTFRYCPVCLEQLYHSFWHQSLFLSHCPLDGAPLLDKCYCCNRLLPDYGFHGKVLSKPYLCQECRGPISGIKVNLDTRLAIQQRKREFKTIFDVLEQWWLESTAVREDLERMLPSRQTRDYAPWLRPDTSVRQWVVTAAPTPIGVPVTTRTLPPLVVLRWKVTLDPDDPLAYIWARRRSKFEKLHLARQAYRSTLRRLTRAIARDTPYDEAEYRRHQALPLDDLVRSSSRCNIKILALIMLRRSYETYFSTFDQSTDKVQLAEDRIGFPYGNEFSMRIRICWRAQFIAEYASFYWWLVAMREGRKRVNDFRREEATLSHVDVTFDRNNGDVIVGSVAFPAVDGLRLDLFP